MVEGKWLPPGADIAPALFLRRAIFTMDRDDVDSLSWQALALWEGQPVGTGRIWWQDGAFMLGMIGVLPDFRGLGCGDFLIRLLLFKAQQHNAVRVALYAPAEAVPFFQKYGFVSCEHQDTEDNIRLELSGDSIILDSCKGCKHQQVK